MVVPTGDTVQFEIRLEEINLCTDNSGEAGGGWGAARQAGTAGEGNIQDPVPLHHKTVIII